LHKKAASTDVQQGHGNFRPRNFALDPASDGEPWVSAGIGLHTHYCLNRPFGGAHSVGERLTSHELCVVKKRELTAHGGR
jgi:hypothetical protein